MDITSTHDLHKSGLSRRTIAARCRPGGPWRQVLPGVVLLDSAYPTRTQRLKAVQTYAPGTIITGVDALREQGAPLPEPELIHMLQGPNQRRTGQGIVFERTTRPPRVVRRGGLALAEPTRAAVDAARRSAEPLRALLILAATVSSGLSTVDALARELDAGTSRGTATARKALTALSAGNFPAMSRPQAFEHT